MSNEIKLVDTWESSVYYWDCPCCQETNDTDEEIEEGTELDCIHCDELITVADGS